MGFVLDLALPMTEDVDKEDVRVAYSLECRWDNGCFENMSVFLFVAFRSEIGFPFTVLYFWHPWGICSSSWVSADSRDLGGMYRSSCRSAKLVFCFHTGRVETAQGQAVRKDTSIPEPGAGEFGVWELPAPCRYPAKESTVWLPTSGDKLQRFRELQLPTFQSQYPLLSIQCSLSRTVWERSSPEEPVAVVTLYGHSNWPS